MKAQDIVRLKADFQNGKELFEQGSLCEVVSINEDTAEVSIIIPQKIFSTEFKSLGTYKIPITYIAPINDKKVLADELFFYLEESHYKYAWSTVYHKKTHICAMLEDFTPSKVAAIGVSERDGTYFQTCIPDALVARCKELLSEVEFFIFDSEDVGSQFIRWDATGYSQQAVDIAVAIYNLKAQLFGFEKLPSE